MKLELAVLISPQVQLPKHLICLLFLKQFSSIQRFQLSALLQYHLLFHFTPVAARCLPEHFSIPCSHSANDPASTPFMVSTKQISKGNPMKYKNISSTNALLSDSRSQTRAAKPC